MHAFTSCDSVSAFAGRGKIGTIKLLKSDKIYQEAFSELGCSWDASAELFKKLQEITCCLYVPSTSITDVNSLQYQVFCVRRGEVESSQLPHCEDCLFMHAIRANYQAAIRKRSSLCQIIRAVNWPQTMIEGWSSNACVEHPHPMSCCSCSPSASGWGRANCQNVRLTNGLKCTNMCKLQTCTNQPSKEEPAAELTDWDVDDDAHDDCVNHIDSWYLLFEHVQCSSKL